jgi:hypothetical protein
MDERIQPQLANFIWWAGINEDWVLHLLDSNFGCECSFKNSQCQTWATKRELASSLALKERVESDIIRLTEKLNDLSSEK